MRRSIFLLAILASLLVSGCKSGAQKKAEAAKAEYEQTIRDGGKQRVRIVNEQLKASGLKPIVTLAEKMPELNLRWLLLGDGEMIDPRDVQIRQKDALLDFVRAGLQAEQYVAVMTADERKVFECKLRSGIVPLFEPFERAELDERLNAHLRAKDADLSLQINKDEIL